MPSLRSIAYSLSLTLLTSWSVLASSTDYSHEANHNIDKFEHFHLTGGSSHVSSFGWEQGEEQTYGSDGSSEASLSPNISTDRRDTEKLRRKKSSWKGNSTQRTKASIQRYTERSQREIARLFPDREERGMALKEFHQYLALSRKYGIKAAKERLTGEGTSSRRSSSLRRAVSEEETKYRKSQENKRWWLRKKLKDTPDDPTLLEKARKLGMDIENPLRQPKKADFVHRFLEIYYPDMVPIYLATVNGPNVSLKKHPLGFSYATGKRSEVE